MIGQLLKDAWNWILRQVGLAKKEPEPDAARKPNPPGNPHKNNITITFNGENSKIINRIPVVMTTDFKRINIDSSDVKIDGKILNTNIFSPYNETGSILISMVEFRIGSAILIPPYQMTIDEKQPFALIQ
jgi:hypothetical protein